MSVGSSVCPIVFADDGVWSEVWVRCSCMLWLARFAFVRPLLLVSLWVELNGITVVLQINCLHAPSSSCTPYTIRCELDANAHCCMYVYVHTSVVPAVRVLVASWMWTQQSYECLATWVPGSTLLLRLNFGRNWILMLWVLIPFPFCMSLNTTCLSLLHAGSAS
jgi:hypothetical protein